MLGLCGKPVFQNPGSLVRIDGVPFVYALLHTSPKCPPKDSSLGFHAWDIFGIQSLGTAGHTIAEPGWFDLFFFYQDTTFLVSSSKDLQERADRVESAGATLVPASLALMLHILNVILKSFILFSQFASFESKQSSLAGKAVVIIKMNHSSVLFNNIQQEDSWFLLRYCWCWGIHLLCKVGHLDSEKISAVSLFIFKFQICDIVNSNSVLAFGDPSTWFFYPTHNSLFSLFLRSYFSLCVCLLFYVWVCAGRYLQMPEQGTESFGAGVTCGCKSFVGSGTWSLVLCKRR